MIKMKITQALIERSVIVTAGISTEKESDPKNQKLQEASDLFYQLFDGHGTASSRQRAKNFIKGMRLCGINLPNPRKKMSEKVVAPLLYLGKLKRRESSYDEKGAFVLVLNRNGGIVNLSPDTCSRVGIYNPDEHDNAVMLADVTPATEAEIRSVLADRYINDDSCGSSTSILEGAGLLQKVEESCDESEADDDDPECI